MLSPADLRNMVVSRRDACAKFKDDRPAKDRKEALAFYRGDNLSVYGDSGDGLSTVVSRDTMEAIEGMMPPLLRPFVAGEEVVAFDPIGEEDEEAAAQATDYVNHCFKRHNNVLHVAQTALKDGLLFRLGVAKTVMEEVEGGPPERYEGLDAAQLDALQTSGQEIAGDIEQDPATGLFSVMVSPPKAKRYRVHVIAPDEFLHEERLASLEDATFLAHSKQITVADLIGMGIEPEKVRGLGSGKPSEENDNRFPGEDSEDGFKSDDPARPVWVDECYIKCDYEGKGVLTWRKVLLGGSGSTVLVDEPADDHPYSTWTPIPIPHKLVGQSIHDLTRDVQMQKTALQREMLNNLYLVNRPQREVVEGQVNLDDLMNPAVNGVVRVRQQGAITPLLTPFVAEKSFPMIEYQDSVRESRTGVTRYNQGMDANSLNKTATGVSIIASASQQRQELVARQFGEFLKDIFKKLYELVRQHADPQEVIRLRGSFVDWATDYDMSVSVGLGTNNKDQLVGHLMALMQLDERIVQLQQGIQGPLLTADNIHEKLKRLVEAMGLKGVDKYYTDPAKAAEMLPPPEEQPDPLAEPRMKAETEIAKEQMRQAGETEREAMKMQAQVLPFSQGML